MFTFQIEKLKTRLSLESTFPQQDISIRRRVDDSNASYPRKERQMFVACRSSDGQVVGFAEVDARIKTLEQSNDIDEALNLTGGGIEVRTFEGTVAPGSNSGASSVG